MEVVVGTYEELILGYRITQDHEFEMSFTDHSHTGCVRSVAISKRGFLASGSSDEMIKLFNIKKHFEIGTLMHHSGIITSLRFHGKTHMLSTSADGTIGVWQVGKWECLRTLKGHKGSVHSISVHPTGKMALSVGQDKTLRIWNLMTGKCAFIKNLKSVADIVFWSLDGSNYLIVTNNVAEVYDVDTAKVTHSIVMTGRINDVHFIKQNIVILAGEHGKVELHDTELKIKLTEFSSDTTRIKGIACCQDPENTDNTLMFTASSDGFIKMWSLCLEDDTTWHHKLLGEVQTKFRLTCIALKVKSPGQTVQESTTSEVAVTAVTDRESETDDIDSTEKSEASKEKNAGHVKKRKSQPSDTKGSLMPIKKHKQQKEAGLSVTQKKKQKKKSKKK